jgi:aldehyde dehydrogenase (NAD+)
VTTPEARLLIDGSLVEARQGGTFANINPATEEPIGVTCDASKEDLDRAIGAARRAFDEDRSPWATDAAFRSRCLEQLACGLDLVREELRETVIAEAGAPRRLTFGLQCDVPIDDLEYWCRLSKEYPYEGFLPDKEILGRPSRRIVRREAAGVVAAITPWNFPLLTNLAKLGPALAAGCTVVLKPAPDTPWSATTLGRVIVEHTEIPPGVINVVPSSDHAIGDLLTADPRVDMISFTGSTVTGRRVMTNAATTIKRVFLELGGKSANIVLDDADFESVLSRVSRMCLHAGQGCGYLTRLLLPASRYEEGLDLAAAAMASVAFGDPNDPKNVMGPLISARQRERVLAYIEQARLDGRVVVGGGTPPQFSRGFYVEPTLVADVDESATVVQEEIFGPVLVVLKYTDDDDAVRLANNSQYGLSGAVHSASLARGLAVARRVRTGTMAVNGTEWISIDTPFGGYRQSGLGKENGMLGLEEYMETKVISTPVGEWAPTEATGPEGS